MLARNADRVFSGDDWIFELKYDGYRMMTHLHKGKVTIYSRNGHSYEARFPRLANEISKLSHDLIIDGEVVVMDKQGHPDFQKLQNYIKGSSEGHIGYYVFDLLFLNGYDTMDLPLLDRKSLLPDILSTGDLIKYTEHIEGAGEALYDEAIKKGLEGIMAKKKSSRYLPGRRSEDWLKIKATQSMDAYICGFTEPSSSADVFGSLVLGEASEGQLSYTGNCGTGFSRKEKWSLLEKLLYFKRSSSPFDSIPNLKGRQVTWVDPVWVCEVNYTERTSAGLLRHPVFKSLRMDKSDVNALRAFEDQPKKKSTMGKKDKNTLLIGGIDVAITHPDKVYWPEENIQKYELIDYYIRIAEFILPYLKNRPQNLHRHPEGIDKKGFYQKDLEHHPDWVETVTIYSESSERDIRYVVCQNEATLVYLANLGCIELNPWNSQIDQLEYPDYGVIDLDPSDKNDFEELRDIAMVAHEILVTADIQSFCKTSGKRGLHIYIPLGGKYTHDESRDFIKILCHLIHEKRPDITSMERSKDKRKNKIYLDYLQNRMGQTLAAPYCVRPIANAKVSAPLEWKELEEGAVPEDFTMSNMPGRLKKKGDIFSAVLDTQISIEKALEVLQSS